MEEVIVIILVFVCVLIGVVSIEVVDLSWYGEMIL